MYIYIYIYIYKKWKHLNSFLCVFVICVIVSMTQCFVSMLDDLELIRFMVNRVAIYCALYHISSLEIFFVYILHFLWAIFKYVYKYVFIFFLLVFLNCLILLFCVSLLPYFQFSVIFYYLITVLYSHIYFLFSLFPFLYELSSSNVFLSYIGYIFRLSKTW